MTRFNDGKMDGVVTQSGWRAVPVSKRREQCSPLHRIQAGRWAEVAVGSGGSSVYVTENGFTQRSDVMAVGSFASSVDQRPYFGLGIATKIDIIEIRYRNGFLQQIAPPAEVDGFYRIVEGGSPEGIPF